jgi:hypothetical protein
MTTEADITNQRDDAVHTLDRKISDAIIIKNGLPLGDPQRLALSNEINDFMASRTLLHIQQLKAGLESAQLAKALTAITNATSDLKNEAAKMTSATSFISNANAMIGAATKVTNVLKNGG